MHIKGAPLSYIQCDQAKPACARCTRLNVPCVGAGQQRYMFKEQRASPDSSDNGRISIVTVSPERDTPKKEDSLLEVVVRSPSNPVTLLANSFIDTIKLTTGVRYNLAWTYGAFFNDIPQRLGYNEALDTSVYALLSAHSNFCSRVRMSEETLNRYSRALGKLRVYLDDPVKAHASETLCATMLLLITQVSKTPYVICFTADRSRATLV